MISKYAKWAVKDTNVSSIGSKVLVEKVALGELEILQRKECTSGCSAGERMLLETMSCMYMYGCEN